MPLNRKVVHVHLIGERRDFYFGSFAAVFKVFTKEDIGVSDHKLRHSKLHEGHAIVNKKAIIMQGDIITTGNYTDFDIPSHRRQRKPYKNENPIKKQNTNESEYPSRDRGTQNDKQGSRRAS